jgi:hypothetical protein
MLGNDSIIFSDQLCAGLHGLLSCRLQSPPPAANRISADLVHLEIKHLDVSIVVPSQQAALGIIE